ncbi:hypothetical protein Salat_1996300 [Sesamum alatum]|uniref:Uncharacterized protein n=1 Tax=Sesamum alatum TaxID=300844 RepID=A0AAE1XYW0_9LAMI|nr:hypothetical protein Salat_1996300 [Sesamum alatum]
MGLIACLTDFLGVGPTALLKSTDLADHIRKLSIYIFLVRTNTQNTFSRIELILLLPLPATTRWERADLKFRRTKMRRESSAGAHSESMDLQDLKEPVPLSDEGGARRRSGCCRQSNRGETTTAVNKRKRRGATSGDVSVPFAVAAA